MTALPRALAPLRRPAYRWIATSLTLSLLASGLWLVGVVWQTVALGGGPSAVSAVSGVGAAGILVTLLLGGALADRIPQTRILLAVEATRAVAIGAVAVLALSGGLTLWHLVVVSLVGGLATGLYYPAYSALLPSLLPAEELLAANGFEGAVRPLAIQAAGPALAGALIAVLDPGLALAVAAGTAGLAALCITRLPAVAVRRDLAAEPTADPLRAVLRDVAEGFRYMVATRWLFATLLFASAMVLVVLGPFEVLTPFAVRDHVGGGAGDHALVLAAFGIGGAVASLLVATFPLPRRYLTVMVLGWGLGCLPLAVFGVVDRLWVLVLAGGVMGALFNSPMVIWGTLLQRRVPPALLGRVSSLDFFVSVSLLPVSMALAGPVGQLLGLGLTFALAGTLPTLFAVIALVAGRLAADELDHPLDVPAGPADDGRGAPPAVDARPAATADTPV